MYKLRWNQVSNSGKNKELVIPFDRNTACFPKHLHKAAENRLNVFKCEVMDTDVKEIDFIKKSEAYRDSQNEIQELRKILKNENLTVVPTDKPNWKRYVCE